MQKIWNLFGGGGGHTDPAAAPGMPPNQPASQSGGTSPRALLQQAQHRHAAAKPSDFVPAESIAAEKISFVGLATLTGHEDRVWSVAWHPWSNRSKVDPPILASCSGDCSVRVWSPIGGKTNEWKVISTIKGEHQRTVRNIAWCPDGQRIACCSFDSTVSVYRRIGGNPCWLSTSGAWNFSVESVLEGHEHEVKSVAWWLEPVLGSSNPFIQAKCYLATCSRDKTAWIWEREEPLLIPNPNALKEEDPDDVEEDKIAFHQELEGTDEHDVFVAFDCAAMLGGHTQDIKCVRWHPDGGGKAFLTTAGYDDCIKLWSENRGARGADDWNCEATLYCGESTVWDIQWQPRAPGVGERPRPRLLAASNQDGAILLWRRAPDPLFQDATNDESNDDGLRWEKAVVGAGEHLLPVYSIEWVPPPENATVSEWLLSGSGDDSIILWQLGVGPEDSSLSLNVRHRETNAHTADCNSVRCAPHWQSNSILVASAGDDGVVRVWQLTIS